MFTSAKNTVASMIKRRSVRLLILIGLLALVGILIIPARSENWSDELAVIDALVEARKLSRGLKVLIISPDLTLIQRIAHRKILSEKVAHERATLTECYPRMDPGTINDYLSKGFRSYAFRTWLGRQPGWLAITGTELHELFQREADEDNSKRWERFYRKFPEATGFYYVSRVGFNAARTQALVHISRSSGALDGVDYSCLLVKKNGRWQLLKTFFHGGA